MGPGRGATKSANDTGPRMIVDTAADSSFLVGGQSAPPRLAQSAGMGDPKPDEEGDVGVREWAGAGALPEGSRISLGVIGA